MISRINIAAISVKLEIVTIIAVEIMIIAALKCCWCEFVALKVEW